MIFWERSSAESRAACWAAGSVRATAALPARQPVPGSGRSSAIDWTTNNNGAGVAAAPVQRCQQVDHFETRTTGYEVTYEYDGQRLLTRLPYNPGTQLRVNVSVTPQ